jgi:hypothetical protein
MRRRSKLSMRASDSSASGSCTEQALYLTHRRERHTARPGDEQTGPLELCMGHAPSVNPGRL